MDTYHTLLGPLHVLIGAQLAQIEGWRAIAASASFYGKSVVILWLLVKTLRMETLDKTTLSRLYLDEQLSIRAIAAHLGVRPRIVYDAMIRWRIPRRSHPMRLNRPAPQYPFDEATLRFLYLDTGETIKATAVQLKVSTSIVISAMRYWNIPSRRSGPKAKRPPPASG